MAKKKTHRLEYRPSFDFLLIGIASDERDYRLAWWLNREMGWDLKREENLKLEVPGKEVIQEFSHYACADEKNLLTFHLIGNHSEYGYLVDELRNIDFFLKISAEDKEVRPNDWISSLKVLPPVRALFPIDPESLKSRQNLLF